MRIPAARPLVAALLLVSSVAGAQQRPDVVASSPVHERTRSRNFDVPELTLWSPNADRFDRSDYTTVYFQVDRPAHIGLFEVGSDGRVRVLFPRTPRDAALVEPNRAYRVLAGAGIYMTGGGRNQIPYVFAVASSAPLDFRKFGNGNRWQYQLASNRSDNPDYTIEQIANMVAADGDASVATDYVYFATRDQYRYVNALQNGGCFGNDYSISERGSDSYFRNFVVPLWGLIQPFFGSGFSYYSGGDDFSCGTRSNRFAGRQTLGTVAATPPAPQPVPERAERMPIDPTGNGPLLPRRAETLTPGAGAGGAPGPLRSEPVRSQPVRSDPVVSEPLRQQRDFEARRRVVTEERADNATERYSRRERERERETTRTERAQETRSSTVETRQTSAPAASAPAPQPAAQPRTTARDHKDPGKEPQ